MAGSSCFPLCCVLFLVLAQSKLGSSDHHEYNYNISDTKYGPLGWPQTFKEHCGGSKQTPIDIKSSEALYDASLDKLTLTKFDTVPDSAKIKVTNNGHTYQVSFPSSPFKVSGGGLPGTYTTLQFHLHWGSVDAKGSEHTVDGKEYPAELHFVNINNKYSGVKEAFKHYDGLAVLGVIYKVGTTENPALTSFLKFAANVNTPSEAKEFPMSSNLLSLLPPNITEFYRYNGSLTTPSCNEAVVWTVFKNYATISANQLNLLRSLKANNHTALVDNYRPIQPLNSRVVKRSFTIATDIVPESGAYHVTGTMITFLSIAMAIFFV